MTQSYRDDESKDVSAFFRRKHDGMLDTVVDLGMIVVGNAGQYPATLRLVARPAPMCYVLRDYNWFVDFSSKLLEVCRDVMPSECYGLRKEKFALGRTASILGSNSTTSRRLGVKVPEILTAGRFVTSSLRFNV